MPDTRRGASLWLVGEHVWLSLVGPELEKRKGVAGIGERLADINHDVLTILIVLGPLLQRLWFGFPGWLLWKFLSEVFVTYGLATDHLLWAR